LYPHLRPSIWTLLTSSPSDTPNCLERCVSFSEVNFFASFCLRYGSSYGCDSSPPRTPPFDSVFAPLYILHFSYLCSCSFCTFQRFGRPTRLPFSVFSPPLLHRNPSPMAVTSCPLVTVKTLLRTACAPSHHSQVAALRVQICCSIPHSEAFTQFFMLLEHMSSHVFSRMFLPPPCCGILSSRAFFSSLCVCWYQTPGT